MCPRDDVDRLAGPVADELRAARESLASATAQLLCKDFGQAVA